MHMSEQEGKSVSNSCRLQGKAMDKQAWILRNVDNSRKV